MPMLALLLLLSGLLGDGNGPAMGALRSQILLAESRPPSTAPHGNDAPSLLLYPLCQDRVLRLGVRHLPRHDRTGDGQPPARSAHIAQIWERADGQWRLRRVVSIDDLVMPR
ncbi:hypothetical protein A9K58_16145 [Stenotrophomonas maltophilia]|uniref:DUF4440 domain-containing protein n=1 Tax=Stenotrophomonas maltophilia TaxID=40324 RepID=A0A1A6XPA7_STEMA|nr:hypothetical protein [Stenotrophomonas maltophilia]OBU64783.1 hypothetical protein A9K58_16145 [Stenotrophomonas maltophilia]